MRSSRFALPLLMAGLAAGQAGPRAYVTDLGRRVLARCEQVVEADIVRVLPPFRGVSTARLRVKRSLLGYDRSPELTLFFIEDYVAPDAFVSTLEQGYARPERRARPDGKAAAGNRGSRTAASGVDRRRRGSGVRLARGDAGLFFLTRKAASYALVGFVPARDPFYEIKRRRLEDVLRLESIAALDLRAESVKRFYLRGLKSTHPWERGNCARELMSLALQDPRLFTREEALGMARRLESEPEPPVQAALLRAVRAIDRNVALDFAREAEARAQKRHAKDLAEERERLERTRVPGMRAADVARVARRYGRAASELTAGFLADTSPLVREQAAQALASIGGPSARAPLRRALEKETDENAARAMIYAAGLLGDPEAVDALRGRLGDPALERTAVEALARLQTRDAKRALQAHRARAAPATRQLIDRLLREEFGEES